MVNKADGKLKEAAAATRTEYKSAMQLLRPHMEPDCVFRPPVYFKPRTGRDEAPSVTSPVTSPPTSPQTHRPMGPQEVSPPTATSTTELAAELDMDGIESPSSVDGAAPLAHERV